MEIEATAEWREDAARAATGLPVAFGTADLKRRGWSKVMIERILGEPDAVVPLRPPGTKHVWRSVRVLEVEAGPEWLQASERARARSEISLAASSARAERVHAEASAAAEALAVDIPSEWTLADLRAAAVASQADHVRSRGGDWMDQPDDVVVNRWIRNYLRHERSNYDALLAELTTQFAGVPGVGEIYEDVVRPSIDELVEQAIAALDP